MQDGLVFASVVKDGPSLVAVDRVTGQLKWARGAMNSAEESEGNVRYLAPPAAGSNVVYAGYVFDDIEGKSHLTSKAGVQCLDSRTGRLIWQREICMLTPPKFSTSRRVRRIRVYGTQPTVADGIVYHTTNAGVIAALDALSGTVIWMARYPHDGEVHDLLKPVGRALQHSRPPLLIDVAGASPGTTEKRLLVAPVDSGRLYCLDPATGKTVWSRGAGQTLLGVNAAGELIVTGAGISALNPRTGETVWSRAGTPADHSPPAELAGGQGVIARPVMTLGNKIYFCGTMWSGVRSEQYWDMTTKKTLAQRWYFDTGYARALEHYHRGVYDRARRENRDPLPSEFVSNATPYFTNYHRFSFQRFGTVFEMEISPQRMGVWYDRDAVARAVATDSSPGGLFNQAELAEIAGDRGKAVALFERALGLLPVWPTPFRTEINRQLFRLYNRQAEAAMRAADLDAAEGFCYQMASACTTSDDEIHTILAMAEVFGKKGRWADAAACLQGAIKHYNDVKIALPGVVTGDTTALRAKAAQLLKNLEDKRPDHFYAREFGLAVLSAETILDTYFSVISPLPADVDVQTGQFAGQWLQRLSVKAPADFRRQLEAAADRALSAETDTSAVLGLIAEYPGTAAAQKALDRLIAAAEKLPEPNRRIELWRLNDAGRLNGLKVPAAVTAACNIQVVEPTPAALTPPYKEATTTLQYDANTLMVVLTPAGAKAPGLPYAFVGMRSKRRYANKFGVVCWDLAANRKKWEADNIRLKDKGEEEGFTKYFIHGDDVIVHGWYDVLAFSLADGKERWRFRVPHGFRVIDSGVAEDLLILTDNTRTIAMHLGAGVLVWEANETGGAYTPPILRDNLVVTARRNPSGVSFRDLGTGRLLGHVQLTSLCEAVENPAVDWGVEGVPWVARGNSLVLTDGWDFLCIDLAERKVRWQRRIADIDRGGAESAAPYRFWANDNTLVVLKPDYDSLGLKAFDLADGSLKWHINEAKNPGVLFNLAIGPDSICGLHYYRDDQSAINILGYKLADGSQLFKNVHRGLKKPQSWLSGPMLGRYVVVRASDEQKRLMLIAEATNGKVVHATEVKGFGEWGNYGDISTAVQGRYLVLLADKDLTVVAPAQ